MEALLNLRLHWHDRSVLAQLDGKSKSSRSCGMATLLPGPLLCRGPQRGKTLLSATF